MQTLVHRPYTYQLFKHTCTLWVEHGLVQTYYAFKPSLSLNSLSQAAQAWGTLWSDRAG